jgi:hypothetical protein
VVHDEHGKQAVVSRHIGEAVAPPLQVRQQLIPVVDLVTVIRRERQEGGERSAFTFRLLSPVRVQEPPTLRVPPLLSDVEWHGEQARECRCRSTRNPEGVNKFPIDGSDASNVNA